MISRRWTPWLILIAVTAALGIGGSFYTYNAMRAYVAGNSPGVVEYFATPRPQAVAANVATPRPEDAPLPKPWNGKERVNILLMGIDQREVNETERVFRTDTMMVLTIDPATMQAGMLSVPRDLWVAIPAYDINDRINTANYWGDANDYPGGGGPQLARKTIESALGIRIHYYVRLNFAVFESFVDRLGGVEVDVPEDIYDTKYPTEDFKTEVFEIKQGKHVLDGITALKYARTRFDKNGDFGRARRQQQVILAIRDKAQDPRVFASLVAAAPEMLSLFGEAIRTDLTLSQIQELAVLAQKLDKSKITNEVLDERYTEYATTPQGWSVLIGNREKIAELRDKLFSNNSVAVALTPEP